MLIDPWLKGNPACPNELKDPGHVDVIAITHGHNDHMEDALDLATKTGATVVAIVEIGDWLETKGVENVVGMNKGGTTAAVFGDMALIRKLLAPDIALLPIGDFYTMGPRSAAEAVRLLGVKTVVPMHYRTFPLLVGTPDELRKEADDVAGLEVVDLKPGDSIGA